MEVPKEPKVYTTVYDNFKGVDYTDDASNVFRRRSPDGLNMLPDLDGKPYKRPGWEVALSAQDFRNAAGVASTAKVIPDKTYYFELGGYDIMLIFNSLGIFSYRRPPISGSQDAFGHILHHLSTFIPIGGGNPQPFPPKIDGKDVPIDSGRAFFFEGGGTAGFYLFVGLRLFRYDGANFVEVQPHIPLVMIGCSSEGNGTNIEDINMLTSMRMISYSPAGETTTFAIPGGAIAETAKVEVIDEETGDFVPLDSSQYTIAGGYLTFNSAPYQPPSGQDNIMLTYQPYGSGVTVGELTETHPAKSIWATKITEQVRTKTDDEPWTEWETTSVEYNSREFAIASDTEVRIERNEASSSAIFPTPNVKVNTSTGEKSVTIQCRNTANTGWETMNANYYSAEWGAYNSEVKVEPKGSILFESSVPPTKTTRVIQPTSVSTKAGTRRTVSTQKRKIYDTKVYLVRVSYVHLEYGDTNESIAAFTQCQRALVYGSGIINQVFMSSSPYPEYNTRVWYSEPTDPTYFPDLNYIEVGANDSPIMGMMKVGEYLGVIKQGTSIDTSIYLAYPTSFDNDTTYAVKQNVNGIGAVSNGAFNILNDEPLFLSPKGVMGIEVSESDVDRQIRNRSHWINKSLCAETGLSQAVSFVFDGMYYLSVNGHCYVLDGAQKNSWANEKTNLQYECYVLDNVPAQCFAKFEGELWFADFKGNMCRFKHSRDSNQYRDAYSLGTPVWTASTAPSNNSIAKSALTGAPDAPSVGETITYGDNWYTITEAGSTTVTVTEGVAIKARWSTIADDDGAVHFFKNLQKKGVVISLMPSSDSGVKVYLKADNKDPIYIGETDAKRYTLPNEVYVKKKVKKYKRLQFICENDTIDDSFGIDQIIKSYTMGNYSKNKG